MTPPWRRAPACTLVAAVLACAPAAGERAVPAPASAETAQDGAALVPSNGADARDEAALDASDAATTVSSDAAATDAADTIVTPDASSAPLPAGTTVLHVGDSMAGALGIDLDKELAARGVRGVLHYKTASFIPGWAFGPALPLYIAQAKPDLVLITLGTNELAMRDPTQRAAGVREIVKRLEGRPCVWIAPLLWKADNGLFDVIRRNVKPCRFLDSNVVAPDLPRLDDRIHPTISARARWARLVVEWLARERAPAGARPWDLKPEP